MDDGNPKQQASVRPEGEHGRRVDLDAPQYVFGLESARLCDVFAFCRFFKLPLAPNPGPFL